MKQDSDAKVDRRDLLRALGASVGAVAAPGALVSEAQADSENNDEKRKARYQADSADVKAFYRVNNYPK
jgi:cysteine synthase